MEQMQLEYDEKDGVLLVSDFHLWEESTKTRDEEKLDHHGLEWRVGRTIWRCAVTFLMNRIYCKTQSVRWCDAGFASSARETLLSIWHSFLAGMRLLQP